MERSVVLGKIDAANIADGKAKHPKSQMKSWQID